VSSYPVEFDAGMARVEEVGVFAESLALPRCVAVGNSGQVDVGVGVGTDQLEAVVAAAAGCVDTVTFSTASVRLALRIMGKGTLKQSERRSRILKKAFRKDPPATLPQLLQRSLLQGL
jgi:hypothetical protein